MSIATNGSLGLKEEAVYGTGVVPDKFVEFADESFKGDSGLIIPDLINGLRVERRVLPGAYTIAGDVNFPLTPEGITGWVLKGIFGKVVTTPNGDGTYTHVFTVGKSIPSFTVDIDRLAAAFRYTGVVFGSLAVSIDKQKTVDCKLATIARKDELITAQVPTFSDLDQYAGIDVGVEINSVPNSDVETASFTFNNEIEPVHTLDGTRFIRKAVPKTFKTDGSFTMEFGDKTMLEYFWGAAGATYPQRHLQSFPLKFNMIQDVHIGATERHYSMTVEFTRVYIQLDAPLKANNRIIQNVAFHPVQDLSTDEVVTVTLVNGESGYPDA